MMQNYESILAGGTLQQQSQSQQQTQQQQSSMANWYDMTIKSEPLDASGSYGQQYSHHLAHMSSQQDTPMSHSSPTSPQSVDSMDSMNGRSQYYDPKASNGMLHGYNPLGFNPLTPPGYSGMFVPQQQQQLARQTTPNRNYNKPESSYVSSTLTPTHTPPMDVTPPKSPKDIAETPEKDDDNLSDCEESYDGSEDEEGIRKPKINSHGKVKKFKCKQCEFIAVTKLSFWEHTRSHIKPEKMLSCPKCPFVTEYKHHLEYHLRNHQRSKPFQCPKCSYSCVNKSMLNSHMKSHSNVFQYRCADCNYATKYCHSLKLHLRKYAHKPDVVLNLDGTPNPLPIIDVYGTRRGPRTKHPKPTDLKQEPTQSSHQTPLTPQNHQQNTLQNPFTPPSAQSSNISRNLLPHQLLPNPLAHMFKNAASNNLPLFPYLNLNFQMFADQQAAIAQLSPNFHQQFSNQFHDKLNTEDHESPSKDTSNSSTVPSAINSSASSNLGEELLKHITAAAADSSDLKSDSAPENDHPEPIPNHQSQQLPTTPSTSNTSTNPATTTTSTGSTGKNRRKGRAFKLERLNEFTQRHHNQEQRPASPMENSDDEEHSESGDQQLQQSNVQSSKPSTSFNGSPVESKSSVVEAGVQTNAPARSFECKYCDITFKDDVLYTIHMGYHGYDDVYKCNMCGEKSEDRIGFFLHIARKAH
ncbi:protein hunchback-like [Uranotaenia lowii]|uniref:protein hunchback-like n=1 Tax=Uranotaenia lowii TaxID=190385 RepID=UPI002479B24C|nr:protein hunchback-like [Uranotaenia lowii]